MEGENPITLCLETQSVFMTYQNIGIAVSFRFRVLGIFSIFGTITRYTDRLAVR